MKIMMVITGMCTGGAERVMATLSNELSQRHTLRLVSMRKEDSDYALASQVDFVKGNISGKNALKATLFVRKQIDAWQPDVVLSFMTKSNIVAIAASRLSRHKPAIIIAERANPYYASRFMKVIRRFLYPLADGAVFQTKQAQEYYNDILKCSSTILKNPLNPDFQIQPYTGVRRKAIVTMGRLSPEKNQKLIIDAFARIAQDYPEYTVEIYGNGPEQQNLQNQIDALGLQGRVLLMGRKNQVQHYIRDAEIFVLPSNSEGMPNALIEAMAMGLASIATDCPIGGSAVIINPDENGILIPMNDVTALEEALRRVLDSRDFSEKLHANAVHVVDTFGAVRVCAQWEKYLLHICSENRRTQSFAQGHK